MRRHRSPILNILQLGIFALVFWQVSQAFSVDPQTNPGEAFDTTFRTMRIVFLGVLATAALNILYPVAVWGIGRLRERQESWEPEERFVVSQAPSPTRQASCPNCGASLFDDTPTCPWCGHALR